MKEIKFKFEELKVYDRSVDFVDGVYRLCDKFPKTERYALTSQFTRAAASIALNIAEGYSDTDKQFNRFLNISLGSVNECVVCTTISHRLNYISLEEKKILRSKLEELSKMITSLQKYLRSKTKSTN